MEGIISLEWLAAFRDITVTMVLGGAVMLFLRGDILPRKVFNDMRALMQTAIDKSQADQDEAAQTLKLAVTAFAQAVEELRRRAP